MYSRFRDAMNFAWHGVLPTFTLDMCQYHRGYNIGYYLLSHYSSMSLEPTLHPIEMYTFNYDDITMTSGSTAIN